MVSSSKTIVLWSPHPTSDCTFRPIRRGGVARSGSLEDAHAPDTIDLAELNTTVRFPIEQISFLLS